MSWDHRLHAFLLWKQIDASEVRRHDLGAPRQGTLTGREASLVLCDVLNHNETERQL